MTASAGDGGPAYERKTIRFDRKPNNTPGVKFPQPSGVTIHKYVTRSTAEDGTVTETEWYPDREVEQ